jgi:hypothetical protein
VKKIKIDLGTAGGGGAYVKEGYPSSRHCSDISAVANVHCFSFATHDMIFSKEYESL